MRDMINAAAFKDCMLCAYAALQANVQTINDLNVFPVPDGDTGTNMGLTMERAAQELRKKDYFVALGVETAQKQSGDVTALILCAERVMYEDKRKYYQLPENNRRHAQR